MALQELCKTNNQIHSLWIRLQTERFLAIECEIQSLKLDVEFFPNTSTEEECFIYLTSLDEMQWYVTLSIESHNKCIKFQYDKSFQPCVFNEGDLVLTYDQKHDKLGKGKFESMWYGTYVVSKVLEKGAYELVDYNGIPFEKPRNGISPKMYYA